MEKKRLRGGMDGLMDGRCYHGSQDTEVRDAGHRIWYKFKYGVCMCTVCMHINSSLKIVMNDLPTLFTSLTALRLSLTIPDKISWGGAGHTYTYHDRILFTRNHMKKQAGVRFG